jgi:vacuolar-type H+-ATPase subunit E/Vma4
MALADLIARLEQDTESQVQAIQQQADVDVVAIDAATEQAVADAMTRFLERRRAERQVVLQRELSVARRQAHTRELEARHALLGRIRERARALVPEVATSPVYLGALPSQLEEALSYLEGLRPRVRCQAIFAPVLQPLVDRTEGADLVIDESVAPGVVAEAADGSVIVDDTLAARLAQIEERLAIELLAEVGDGRL